MPLSVASFKQVAMGFQTHKEAHTADDPENRLSRAEIEGLRQQYASVPDGLFERILRVRKSHREHVPDMLKNLVEFRKANGWKLTIDKSDINSRVQESGAHSLGGMSSDDKTLPIIYYKLHEIDIRQATAKDFQLQCQYVIQEASNLHPEGEVAVTLDFEQASFAILGKLSTEDMSRGMHLFSTYPVKVKRVYVKNDSKLIRLAIKAVLAFASRHVQSKVIFLS